MDAALEAKTDRKPFPFWWDAHCMEDDQDRACEQLEFLKYFVEDTGPFLSRHLKPPHNYDEHYIRKFHGI